MSTSTIMRLVLLTLVPGTAASVYFYGVGYAIDVLTAIALGLTIEALCLHMRGRPVVGGIADGSTVVTCTLLGLALPPGVPWFVVTVAVVAAVGIAKHLYGGLGNNLFNPAVVGYAVVLISYPVAMAKWPVPLDGITSATALVSMKYREGMTVAQAWNAGSGFGRIGGYGWEWMNAAFLLGGLALVAMRLAAWRIPTAILATLGLLALACYDSGSSASSGSPLFHWFTGATMLTVFFFATDPVTHPATGRGQILFGILVGTVIFVVRAIGNYPDGAAFAILLGNALTPYLDKRLAAAEVAIDG